MVAMMRAVTIPDSEGGQPKLYTIHTYRKVLMVAFHPPFSFVRLDHFLIWNSSKLSCYNDCTYFSCKVLRKNIATNDFT